MLWIQKGTLYKQAYQLNKSTTYCILILSLKIHKY